MAGHPAPLTGGFHVWLPVAQTAPTCHTGGWGRVGSCPNLNSQLEFSEALSQGHKRRDRGENRGLWSLSRVPGCGSNAGGSRESSGHGGAEPERPRIMGIPRRADQSIGPLQEVRQKWGESLGEEIGEGSAQSKGQIAGWPLMRAFLSFSHLSPDPPHPQQASRGELGLSCPRAFAPAVPHQKCPAQTLSRLHPLTPAPKLPFCSLS